MVYVLMLENRKREELDDFLEADFVERERAQQAAAQAALMRGMAAAG